MKKIDIFMYHDIRDLNNTDYPNRYKQKSFIRLKTFINQINYIVNNYHVISMKTLNNMIDNNDTITENFAVLTFDDGLLDHYKIIDILSDNNISGIFFIPVLPIINRKPILSHIIQFIIGESDNKLITKEILNFFPKTKNEIWNLYSKTEWKDNHWTNEEIFITNFLRKHNDPIKHTILDFLFKKYLKHSELELSNDLYLTIPQIKEMISCGMEIGGHGYSSQNLTLLTDDDCKNDIYHTTNFLKSFDINNLYFSYPNGGYSQKIIDMLSKSGYNLALTTKNLSIVNFCKNDKFQLTRIDASQKLII